MRRLVARLLRRCSEWTDALSRRLFAWSVRLDPGQQVLGGRAALPDRRPAWSPGPPPAHWAARVRRHAPALLARTSAFADGDAGLSAPSATVGPGRVPEPERSLWPAMPAPARGSEPHGRPDAVVPDGAFEPAAAAGWPESRWHRPPEWTVAAPVDGSSPMMPEASVSAMALAVPAAPASSRTPASASRRAGHRGRATPVGPTAKPAVPSRTPGTEIGPRRGRPRGRTTLEATQAVRAVQPIELTGPEAAADDHTVDPWSDDVPWPVSERAEREGSRPAADPWPRARRVTPAASSSSPYPTLPDDDPLWIDEAVPEDVTDAEHLDRLDREQRGHAWTEETGRN